MKPSQSLEKRIGKIFAQGANMADNEFANASYSMIRKAPASFMSQDPEQDSEHAVHVGKNDLRAGTERKPAYPHKAVPGWDSPTETANGTAWSVQYNRPGTR